jgi:hypothetical protein
MPISRDMGIFFIFSSDREVFTRPLVPIFSFCLVEIPRKRVQKGKKLLTHLLIVSCPFFVRFLEILRVSTKILKNSRK